MKIYVPLLVLIIGTLFFTSCSSDDAVVATATTAGVSDPNTDATLGITGQTMTIGSIDYTTSLVSNCSLITDLKTKAGAAIYVKTQIFLYDNKTLLKDSYHYSDSSCTTTSGSSIITDDDDYTFSNPVSDPEDNASFIVGSSETVTGTVYDNSSTAIDNSTYFTLIYNCIGDGKSGQGGVVVYPKSTTELQMHDLADGACSVPGPVVIERASDLLMNSVYTPK
jgi:hypothetical protein